MLPHFPSRLSVSAFPRIALRVALAAAALGGGALPSQAADTFEVLRKGGYTLFFRHTQSDWRDARAAAPQLPGAKSAQPQLPGGGKAAVKIDKSDTCAGERQLSEEGRADARALGIAVKSLNLPISEVTAASLCRMQETAKIAFGAPKTALDLAPRPGVSISLSAQAAALDRLARAPLPDHGIRVIVGDYEVAQALYGVTLAEGDALVLRNGADGRPEAVTRVRFSDWRAIAPVASSAPLPGQATSGKF